MKEKNMVDDDDDEKDKLNSQLERKALKSRSNRVVRNNVPKIHC